HTEAFMDLKQALVSEPILKGPWFDSSPFIVTTDGSQDSFSAVLAQKHTTMLPSGKVITATH
ncbi:hypothetical protein BDR06DRAFT_834864, partial [Suillus hirtellus]